MAILGWSVARRIKFFLSKSLKTEYVLKSRDLLRFYSNFNITLILKKPNFKDIEIWTPNEEKLQIFPDFPDFWPKMSHSELNKTKYTMDPGIYFLMKTNK